MKTTVERFGRVMANDPRDDRGAPDDASIARFGALMGDMGHDARHVPAAMPAEAATSDTLYAALPVGQDMALRVASGPLAGLRLRLHWRDGRLGLCFETADTVLARRLQAGHAALAASLAQVLGVAVSVGVCHDAIL
ncbi:hypothetical protein [Paludibacterium sp.]|uniref:hypothetical protein n=1 Tax=Paludibacterium sp. TaxID=1917523 RepID=UPI0025FE330B|nr:hypothetical protein [Paludibacterium sp.]MBV8646349.1 hypothetical protein [Paludibacterium sp.]